MPGLEIFFLLLALRGRPSRDIADLWPMFLEGHGVVPFVPGSMPFYVDPWVVPGP